MLEQTSQREELVDQNGSGGVYEGAPTKASVLRLVILAVIVITPAITPGMSTSYSAIATRQLDLSLEELSWFVSIMAIATPIGNLFTGFTLDRYGRRPTLILCTLPSIFGWFLLGFKWDSNVPLYVGRLLTGFALGTVSLPPTIYAAECIAVNDLHLRSSLSSWTTLALGCGILLTYVLGAFLPYDQVAFGAFIISVVSLCLTIAFVPESPIWLYRKGRIGDALLAEKQLGISQPILKPGRMRTLSECSHEPDTDFTLKGCIQHMMKMKKKEVYKPLLITVILFFFLQFSGVYSLTAFMVDVIEVPSVSFSPYLLAVVSGVLQVAGVIISTFVMPVSGVKRLCVCSSFGVALGMVVLGTTITFSGKSNVGSVIDWIHVVSVWLVVMSASLGFLSIPYLILGEIFPMGTKGFASISLFASSVFNFIVLKIHPIFVVYYGPMLYYGYALMSFGGTLFVILFLPETVGKTLEEIKNGFKYKKQVDSI